MHELLALILKGKFLIARVYNTCMNSSMFADIFVGISWLDFCLCHNWRWSQLLCYTNAFEDVHHPTQRSHSEQTPNTQSKPDEFSLWYRMGSAQTANTSHSAKSVPSTMTLTSCICICGLPCRVGSEQINARAPDSCVIPCTINSTTACYTIFILKCVCAHSF